MSTLCFFRILYGKSNGKLIIIQHLERE